MLKFYMAQSRLYSGPARGRTGMKSFFLPGRYPLGFLLLWEKEELWTRELYWRLSEQLSWEYSGVREEGLCRSQSGETGNLIRGRLGNGAVLFLDGTDYQFYRKCSCNLFLCRKNRTEPFLPPWQQGDSQMDSCFGRGGGEGFYLLAGQDAALPDGFWDFCHVSGHKQHQLAEYVAGGRENPFPAAVFYWK